MLLQDPMDSPYNSDEENQGDDCTLLYDLAAITRHALKELNIASMLCPLESSRMRLLEEEICLLKDRIRLLEKEILTVKLKRWCTWCLQEAIYQSKNDKFYCCTQCEQLDILLSDD